MNKKLIALAIAAGLAAPMAANAGMTVYGAVQVEIADIDEGEDTPANPNTGSVGSTYMGTDDNKRGQLGIKGDHDLGGGLKALYKMEWQTETTQGNVADGTRESYVGLSGGFGTVTAGSNKQPYKYAGGVTYDPFVATYLEARSRGGMSGKWVDGTNIREELGAKGATGVASGAFGHHGFFTDSIKYSNKFGMAKFEIATSLDEKGGAKGADGDIMASLKFGDKNWEAFVAMASDDSIIVTKASSDYANLLGNGGPTVTTERLFGDYSATKVGGKMKFGPHTVKLQVESTELSIDSYSQTCSTGAAPAACTPVAKVATGLPTIDGDVMFLGYEFAFGKNTVVAQLGNTEVDFGGGDKGEIDYMAIGLIHKFSKQARVFVGHSTSDFSDNDPATKDIDTSVTSIGMRVDF